MQRSTRSCPTSSLSFASELVGLIARKDTSTSKHRTKKKDSFARILPSHSPPLFKSGPWSLNNKWHPPLTMTANSPITGVSTRGTKCMGQTPTPSPPNFLVSHLPSHLPWKHHALSNKTHHLLCCCQHRGNSHINNVHPLVVMTQPEWFSLSVTDVQV